MPGSKADAVGSDSMDQHAKEESGEGLNRRQEKQKLKQGGKKKEKGNGKR
jgi:hypothetical protein